MTHVFKISLIAFATSAYGGILHAGEVYFDAVVTEPGKLHDTLGDNIRTIDSLAVEGQINVEDFKTMWEAVRYHKLRVINLEKADVENKTIPEQAFWWYSKEYDNMPLPLKKIMLPDDIEIIGGSAFRLCELSHIDLPASLKTIGFNSFSYTLLEEIEFPDGLEAIKAEAFREVVNLKKAVLPNSVQTLENSVFRDCSNLAELVLPDGLKEIPSCIAMNAVKLKEITLPESVTVIYGSAFKGCTSLQTINIPWGVWVIDSNAFNGCTSLKNIVVPEGLTRIGEYAFMGTAIESFSIPPGVTFVGDLAFGKAASLREVYSRSATPPECTNNLINHDVTTMYFTPFGDGISPDIPVYVPKGTAESYRSAKGWDFMTNYIEVEEFPSSGIGAIAVSDPTPADIYTLNGIKVKSGVTDEVDLSDCTPGVYIIKRGGEVTKVIR